MEKRGNLNYCKKEMIFCREAPGSKNCTPLPETGHCKYSCETLLCYYEKLGKEFEERISKLQSLSEANAEAIKKARPDKGGENPDK